MTAYSIKQGLAATLTYEVNADLTNWDVTFVAMTEAGGAPVFTAPVTVVETTEIYSLLSVSLSAANTATAGHFLTEIRASLDGGDPFAYPSEGGVYSSLDITPLPLSEAVPSWDTADDLVDEVISNILGPDVGNVATLEVAVDTDDLVLKLDDVTGLSRCAIEVDHELMLVSRVDPGANTATLFPRGRGYRGTTPAPHDVGAMVTVAPDVARSTVLRELNNELAELYPSVMAVEAEDLIATDGIVALATDVAAVLDVMAKVDDQWVQVRKWVAWAGAPREVAATGYALRTPTLPDATELRVIVGRRPRPIVSTRASFTDTGLPSSVKPLVVAGTVLRLLPAFDAYRLSQARVGDNGQAQVGPASILARELKSRRAELLVQEQRALRTLYPARVHFV